MSQYPLMETWSQAGVTGGIPNNLQVVSTINPGDNIQAAIDSVANAGGGVLLLRNGVYNVFSQINVRSNVVVRGEGREGVRIESRVTSGSTFELASSVRNAGIENLTLNYEAPDGSLTRPGWYGNTGGSTSVNGITILGSNSWVRSTNILNSGNDPLAIRGNHNTLTDNYVDGAYNKAGGRGYYRITGKHNLIKGETVKDIRHYGILTDNAEFNVTVDSYFATDINYHTGDLGNNLFEGNTVDLPGYHGWATIATGGIRFGHMPPGIGNLIFNNYVFHAQDKNTALSQENVVYRFEGYGYPVATNIPVPDRGRFYVSAYPQITLVAPPNGTVLNDGSDIEVEVLNNHGVETVRLYRDGELVSQKNAAPFTWSVGSQDDPELQDLAEGTYDFRVEAMLSGGGTLEESFTVIVDDSYDVHREILAVDADSRIGSLRPVNVNGVSDVLGFTSNGNSIGFQQLKVEGANTFTIEVDSGRNGRVMRLRSESPTGPLLGEIFVNDTGGDFVPLTTSIPTVTEPLDLYIVYDFAGFSVRAFEFGSSEITVDTTQTSFDYDFGTPTSPVEDGLTRISPHTTGDISWSGAVDSRDRGPGGGVGNVNRDLVFSSATRTLSHTIANGVWNISLTMGDLNSLHDNASVVAEGVTLTSDVDNAPGEFPVVTGQVVVNDGELNLTFADNGGADVNWVVNRLSLELVDTFSPPLLSGDYNEDGSVDAADYTVWRDTLNQSVRVPYEGADGNGNGAVDGGDYDTWVANYGDRITTIPLIDAATGNGEFAVDDAGLVSAVGGGSASLVVDPQLDRALRSVSVAGQGLSIPGWTIFRESYPGGSSGLGFSGAFGLATNAGTGPGQSGQALITSGSGRLVADTISREFVEKESIRLSYLLGSDTGGATATVQADVQLVIDAGLPTARTHAFPRRTATGLTAPAITEEYTFDAPASTLSLQFLLDGVELSERTLADRVVLELTTTNDLAQVPITTTSLVSAASAFVGEPLTPPIESPTEAGIGLADFAALGLESSSDRASDFAEPSVFSVAKPASEDRLALLYHVLNQRSDSEEDHDIAIAASFEEDSGKGDLAALDEAFSFGPRQQRIAVGQ